jgi:hypothetical protein
MACSACAGKAAPNIQGPHLPLPFFVCRRSRFDSKSLFPFALVMWHGLAIDALGSSLRGMAVAEYRHALPSELDGVLTVPRDLNEDRYAKDECVGHVPRGHFDDEMKWGACRMDKTVVADPHSCRERWRSLWTHHDKEAKPAVDSSRPGTEYASWVSAFCGKPRIEKQHFSSVGRGTVWGSGAHPFHCTSYVWRVTVPRVPCAALHAGRPGGLARGQTQACMRTRRTSRRCGTSCGHTRPTGMYEAGVRACAPRHDFSK